jgi:hypothetical protein
MDERDEVVSNFAERQPNFCSVFSVHEISSWVIWPKKLSVGMTLRAGITERNQYQSSGYYPTVQRSQLMFNA